jgi:hypothetical protein
VRQTDETKRYTERLRAWADAAGLHRARLEADGEGFPTLPGRRGRIDYGGPEESADRKGEERLYVYTFRKGMVSILLTIPGVQRWQMGAYEARLWFPATDASCLRAVGAVIQFRIRRPPSKGNLAGLEKAWASRRASQRLPDVPAAT